MSAPSLIGQYRDGFYRRAVKDWSTGVGGFTTGTYEVSPEESGMLFHIGTLTTAHFSLPRVSSLFLGMEYEFAISSPAAAQDVNIVSTLDTSAHITMNGLSSAELTTASAITPGNFEGVNFVVITAVSSVVWVARAAVGYTSESSGATVIGEDLNGGFIVGSTQ